MDGMLVARRVQVDPVGEPRHEGFRKAQQFDAFAPRLFDHVAGERDGRGLVQKD